MFIYGASEAIQLQTAMLDCIVKACFGEAYQTRFMKLVMLKHENSLVPPPISLDLSSVFLVFSSSEH